MKKLTSDGQEIPDPTPVALPVGLKKSESMDERIRRILQHSISAQAAKHGLETFEEADDFDIPDDPVDPTTLWEDNFDFAAVQGVERGVVQPPPQVSPERLAELEKKFSKKKPIIPDPPSKPKEPPAEG